MKNETINETIKDEMVEVRKADLMDVIIAQNAMIEELLDEITELEMEVEKLEKKQAKHKPAVVENGVLVSLGRVII